jgi:L-fuconolactonase
MPSELIDIHPHVISDDDERYPKDPLGGVQSKWSQARPTTWEQLEAAMDEAGVTKAAVVQSSTTYGHDNSYVADCVDRSGGKITGVCSVSFVDDDSVDRIRYWITDRGMSGVRLFTTGSTMSQAGWLDDERTRKCWSYVTDNGIPVCVQLRQEAIPQLRNILDEYRGLRVILDHVAMSDFTSGPPYSQAEAAYALAAYDGVHLKVTSRVLTMAGKSEGGVAAVLPELIEHFGSHRIAWGSNFPASDGSLPELVAQLDAACADLSAGDVANVRSGTALALYPKLG